MGVSYPKNSAGGWLAGLTPAPSRPSLRMSWINPLGCGLRGRVSGTFQNLLPACLETAYGSKADSCQAAPWSRVDRWPDRSRLPHSIRSRSSLPIQVGEDDRAVAGMLAPIFMSHLVRSDDKRISQLVLCGRESEWSSRILPLGGEPRPWIARSLAILG